MKIVNLTPHTLNIQNASGEMITIPSTGLARCKVESFSDGTYAGINLYTVRYGAVEGLPDNDGDAIYVVSMLVRNAVPARYDVFSPGELIRDEKGNPIGCIGLIGN